MLAPFQDVLKHSGLLLQLIQRELKNKYQGTLIGFFWSLLNPLIMLLLYTFVFRVVFKARWPDVANTNIDFASILFIGLLVHAVFAEVLIRSSAIIIDNTNYVKKVVFPLSILGWSLVAGALINLFIGLTILLAVIAITDIQLSSTFWLIPVVAFPLLILCTGISWIISAVGVYFRDMGQLMPGLATLLLFSSTAFFPPEAAPESIRPFIMLNPLSIPIDMFRDVIIYERTPSWSVWSQYTFIAFIILFVGRKLFQRLSKGFADVL